MKLLMKLAKDLGAIKVIGGFATATNLALTIIEPCDKNDGLYNPVGFAEGLNIKSALDDFPPSPDLGDCLGERVYQVEDLEFVSKAVCDKEARYYLHGVYLNGKDVVASDGHTLSMVNLGGSVDFNHILPNYAVKAILGIAKEKKVGTARIEFYTKHLKIFVGDAVIISDVIDGNFPDFNRVVPSPEKAMIVTEFDVAEFKAQEKTIKLLMKAAISLDDGVILNDGLASYQDDHQFPVSCKIEGKFKLSQLLKAPSGTLYYFYAPEPILILAGNKTSVIMPIRQQLTN